MGGGRLGNAASFFEVVPMTKAEAKSILTQVCAQYRGTLDDHRQIQTALGMAFVDREIVGSTDAEKETVTD